MLTIYFADKVVDTAGADSGRKDRRASRKVGREDP